MIVSATCFGLTDDRQMARIFRGQHHRGQRLRPATTTGRRAVSLLPPPCGLATCVQRIRGSSLGKPVVSSNQAMVWRCLRSGRNYRTLCRGTAGFLNFNQARTGPMTNRISLFRTAVRARAHGLLAVSAKRRCLTRPRSQQVEQREGVAEAGKHSDHWQFQASRRHQCRACR